MALHGPLPPRGPPPEHMLRGTAAEVAIGAPLGPPPRSYGTDARAGPPLAQSPKWGTSAEPPGQRPWPRSYGTAASVFPPASDRRSAGTPRRSDCNVANEKVPDWCMRAAKALAVRDSTLQRYSTEALLLELYHRAYKPDPEES